MATTSHPGRSVGEILCAASFLALGLFVMLYGRRYPMIKDGVVGPGVMPTIAGIALVATAASLLWKALRPVASATKPSAPAEEGANLSLGQFSEDESEAPGQPTTVAGILVMLVLTVLLAPLFGLLPMMGALVFVCLFVFERRRLTVALAVAAGSTAVSWLLFVNFFKIPMPVGSIWQIILGQ